MDFLFLVIIPLFLLTVIIICIIKFINKRKIVRIQNINILKNRIYVTSRQSRIKDYNHRSFNTDDLLIPETEESFNETAKNLLRNNILKDIINSIKV